MYFPFRITACGLDELVAHCEARVSYVLSILDPDWPVPEVFGTFGRDQQAASAAVQRRRLLGGSHADCRQSLVEFLAGQQGKGRTKPMPGDRRIGTMIDRPRLQNRLRRFEDRRHSPPKATVRARGALLLVRSTKGPSNRM